MKLALIVSLALALATAEDLEQQLNDANNQFAIGVYQQLSQTEKENFLFSPFSAELILAHTLNGARGQSAVQLREALHLPSDRSKLIPVFINLRTKITSDPFYTLTVANKVYVKKDLAIKANFSSVGTLVYGTETENIEFAPNNVQAAETINQWVEQTTNNKIKDIVQSADIDKNTRAILINALHFQANWSVPFPVEDIKRDKFYKNPSTTVEVPMLHLKKKSLIYYESPQLEAQFLELPLQSDGTSVVFVLPNAKGGLSSLESQVDQIFSEEKYLKKELLNVALPKFKFESTVDFKTILQKLGVTEVFQPFVADLSGIAGPPGDLYLEKVTQKTYIDVNEVGVEAAAATELMNNVFRSLEIYRTEPKDFIADHPFIFYVKVGGVVAFVGRVTDPSEHVTADALFY